MATLYNADLKPLASGVPTQPYQHAAKLFLSDNYRLAPKQTFLYYVVINVDPSQSAFGGGFLGSVLNFADRFQAFENGLLVKRIDLPKYTINNKVINEYNKKSVVTTHLTYEPITVTFHDDAADVITNFWNDYYTFYFRDSDYGVESYRAPTLYNERNKVGWGFSPHNGGVNSNTGVPIKSLIKNIRIFSLHNKRFTEYCLINPSLTSWRHGEHDSSQGTGTMQNVMTVQYEAVKYYTGYINPVSVDGFSLLYYDTTPSPISTSTTNIYTDAGILGAIDGAPKDLARPDGQFGAGGPLSSILSAYRAYNNLKNVNLKTVVGSTLGQVGASVLNNGINSLASPFVFPTLSGGLSGTGSSVTYNNSTNGMPGTAYGGVNPFVTVGGAVAGSAIGAAINTSNQVLDRTLSDFNRGVNTALGNSPQNPGSTRVFDVAATTGGITINPRSLQPVTGTTTAFILDDNGKVVSEIQTTGVQGGGYIAAEPLTNLKSVQTTADENNNIVVVRTYNNGDQVVEDAEGNNIGFTPGAQYTAKNINTNPADARTLAQNGITLAPGTVQYRTDPTTGITYTVNGGTTGQITNAISGTAGATAGLYAGQTLNSALNSTFLGKTVFGRTLSAATSTAVGASLGRAVNNGLQPIVNSVTGRISQAFDTATGSIKNVVGSWTGSGGFDPSKPLDNIVTSQTFDDGSKLFTYKDGTVRSIATDGTESVTQGSNNSGFLSWFNGAPGQNRDVAATTSSPGAYWTDGSGNPIQTSTGDPVGNGFVDVFTPVPITDAQWQAQADADQAAIQEWASQGDAGVDNLPTTPPEDLNDFYG